MFIIVMSISFVGFCDARVYTSYAYGNANVGENP